MFHNDKLQVQVKSHTHAFAYFQSIYDQQFNLNLLDKQIKETCKNEAQAPTDNKYTQQINIAKQRRSQIVFKILNFSKIYEFREKKCI